MTPQPRYYYPIHADTARKHRALRAWAVAHVVCLAATVLAIINLLT